MGAAPHEFRPDAETLRAGLNELGLGERRSLERRLLDYVALLAKWNRSYNLVSTRSQVRLVPAHVLDSLAVAPYRRGESVLDVGTGAGLPGLVLAVAEEHRHFTLLDSNGKKTRFCLQVCAELSLRNVEVVQARVEDYRPGVVFSTVVSRAYASVGALFSQVVRLIGPGGRLLALKGAEVDRELQSLGADAENATVVPLRVPGLDARRHLLIVDPCVSGRSTWPR